MTSIGRLGHPRWALAWKAAWEPQKEWIICILCMIPLAVLSSGEEETTGRNAGLRQMVQGRLQQIPAFAIHDSHEASAGVPLACRKAQAPTWSAFVI